MQTIRVISFFEKSSIRNGETIFHDWVRYAPVHAAQTVVNEERIDRLMPNEAMESDPDRGERANFIRARWAEIEPAYSAWKAGNEIPTNGTALSAWPGVTPEQAQSLKASGLRTIEDVATIPDHMLSKVHLPNMRDLRNQAKAFLDARGTVNVASELAKRDAELASMREQLDAALGMLNDLTAPAGDAPKRGRKPRVVDADTEDEAA